MRYFDLKKNWRKVKPHIEHPEVQAVLVRDFNKYTFGRWGQRFLPGMLPTQFESCDWQCDHRGKPPAYWSYCKHAACHWLANFTLRLAERVEPGEAWRIISTQEHSTVWNGKALLFDFNFQALGIPAKECFETAYRERRELPPGKLLRVYHAAHFSKDR